MVSHADAAWPRRRTSAGGLSPRRCGAEATGRWTPLVTPLLPLTGVVMAVVGLGLLAAGLVDGNAPSSPDRRVAVHVRAADGMTNALTAPAPPRTERPRAVVRDGHGLEGADPAVLRQPNAADCLRMRTERARDTRAESTDHVRGTRAEPTQVAPTARHADPRLDLAAMAAAKHTRRWTFSCPCSVSELACDGPGTANSDNRIANALAGPVSESAVPADSDVQIPNVSWGPR